MMKTVRSFLCIAIAIMLFMTSFPVSDFAIEANAATTINYSPNPKVEYSYSTGVSAGTIRYISQINGSTYFNSIYWGSWANQAGIECGTASISMSLSYIGIDKTPKTILDVNSGITYFTGWGVDTKSYSYDNLGKSFDNYINGKGKYSPPIIHLNNYSSAGHFVVLIGRISNNQYAVLDPANATVWSITINGASAQYTHPSNARYINDSIDRSNRADDIYQYYNPNASMPSSAPATIIKTSYPSHCTIKVTENDKNIMSLPCSNKTNSKSDKVESAPKGTTYEAIGLIKNTEDNLWYKVKAKNGKEGYIFAGNVAFESTIKNDIVASGISVPANHTQGKSYVLTGSVKDPYNIVSEVSVNIYSGSNTSGTSETGGSESINTTSFALGGSSIDKNTKFNILPVGKHTYVVRITYKNYFAKSDKESAIKTATGIIYKQTFNVVSSHSHSYSSHYEAAHPHKVYNKCSCGDWHYTGATTSVSSCTQCNPAEPSTIIYPADGSIYKIASGVGNNMYLDFAVTNNNVQISENCDGHSDPAFVKSQYFKITHVGDGWYTISNIGNNLAADVATASPESGTNIIQYEHHQGGSQQFRFYDAGDGYCYIKSSLGTYMDVQNGDNVNNTNVWAYSFNGTNAQKWKLEKHSHAYSSKVTTAATCTKSGVRTYTCSGCLSSYTESIPASSHSYGSWSVTKNATCTTVGSQQRKCSKCNDTQTQEIAKTNHNYASNIIEQATCYNYGKQELICSCGNTIIEQIKPKGHYDNDKNGKCDSCYINLTSQSKIKLSLTENTTEYAIVNVIVENSEEFVTNLEIIYDGKLLSCESFIWGDLINTNDVIAAYDDSRLGSIKISALTTNYIDSNTSHILCKIKFRKQKPSDNINITMIGDNSDKLFVSGHTHKIVNVDEVNSTCTENGYTAGVFCNDCQKYISGHTEIPVDTNAHKWNNGAITTTATCTVSGVKTYTCQHNSSHKKTENLGINASNHVNTKNVPETPATFETVGYTAGVYCNDCKKYISGHTEIPRLVPVFTDSKDAKVNGNDILSNNGLTAAQLLSLAGKGAVIMTSDGKAVENTSLIGTGMILTMTDGSKKEIVVYGDVDGNGKITAADARKALRASVSLEKYKETSAQYKAANVESKNKISASDARLILRSSVGLEDAKTWMK